MTTRSASPSIPAPEVTERRPKQKTRRYYCITPSFRFQRC
jgi:hypothetical protein